jgi:alkyl sulfatase BDS1-like metallo-beta-lactamase superfamily hydrolase
MNKYEAAVGELIQSRPAFSHMAPACQTEAIQINDFIYMSQGTSNAYMVVTDAGRVIINTGMGFEALTHKKVFDAVCPGPTPYLLLTQGHVDHVGGVAQFREEATQLVAQSNLSACQRDDERITTVRQGQSYIWFKKTIDKAIAVARHHPEVFVQDTPVADITYHENYKFNLGGIDFELISTPGGETMDSAIVWLPQYKILFSGNLTGPLFPHFPNFNTIRGDRYRFIEPYLTSISKARSLGASTLITGHFEPVEGAQLIADSFARLHAAVDYVHSTTLQRMNEGTDIYTLMDEITLPAAISVGEGYGKVSWAVRTIWESYLGWFKADKTSELYATQVESIYPDLVELAGLDAVIDRARQKLQKSQPEAAMLLAEAVLAAAPDEPAAVNLAIDVITALRERAAYGNFWEDGWLRSRVDLLRQRLDRLVLDDGAKN